jgi:hypothetical protein
VVFVKWQQVGGKWRVPVLDEIGAWALANGEYLPGSRMGHFYRDLTAQAEPWALSVRVLAARLRATDATAQEFAGDNRLFVLGYRRITGGRVVFNNWSEPLDGPNRQRVLTFLRNQGYTLEQITARFTPADSRREIAWKLMGLFRGEAAPLRQAQGKLAAGVVTRPARPRAAAVTTPWAGSYAEVLEDVVTEEAGPRVPPAPEEVVTGGAARERPGVTTGKGGGWQERLGEWWRRFRARWKRMEYIRRKETEGE